MKTFNICVQLSGITSRTVEAETLEEAEEIVMDMVYNSDWNDIDCPDIDVLDYEEC